MKNRRFLRGNGGFFMVGPRDKGPNKRKEVNKMAKQHKHFIYIDSS
jgi:hypothetical protein